MVGNSSYNYRVVFDIAGSRDSVSCAEFCNLALRSAGLPKNVITNGPNFFAALPGDIAASSSFTKQPLDTSAGQQINPRLNESVSGK
jgi:hypothetical protein